MHTPISRDESVTRDSLLCHAKVRCAVCDKLVRFFKRAFIQKEIDALPCGKLAGLALALPPLCATALFGNGVPSCKLCQVALMAVGLRRGLRGGTGLRNGTL